LAHARISVDGLTPQPGAERILLPPGEHLVQILDPEPRTFMVTLEPAQEAWLVVPNDHMDELLTRLDEPESRSWLEVLFAAWPLDEPLDEAWLVHGQQSWRYRAPGQWQQLEAPPRPIARPTMRLGGQALAFGGLGATATFGVKLLHIRHDIAALEDSLYWDEVKEQLRDELEADRTRETRCLGISAGVTGLGAALWLGSRWVPLPRDPRVTVAPGWSEGQVTLALRAELP
jgi:hypothetical protein